MLGITDARLRYWLRAGFVMPGRGAGGRYCFRFQDLVVLRTAEALVAGGVSIRLVSRVLAGLRQSLPADRPLSELKLAAVDGRVVLEEDGRCWESPSGQGRLRFEPTAGQRRSSKPAVIAVAMGEPATSEATTDPATATDWCELGLALETSDLPEAIAAYRCAIEAAPGLAAPYLNLGRLLHEQGDLAAAEELYRQARSRCPEDATATFNLGVVLQDGERWREAAHAYRRAIELDADYADAFYNLAAVYEQLGDRAVALQTLQAYRRLTRI